MMLSSRIVSAPRTPWAQYAGVIDQDDVIVARGLCGVQLVKQRPRDFSPLVLSTLIVVRIEPDHGWLIEGGQVPAWMDTVIQDELDHGPDNDTEK